MYRLPLLLALLLAPTFVRAQTATVTGHVTGTQQVPMEGVSVFVPGTLAATFTDADGRYTLPDVPAGEAEIHAVFAGYRTGVARRVLTPGETATVDFTLRRRPFWERAALFSTDPDAEVNSAIFALPRALDANALPARTTAEASGLLPGAVRDERSDTLTFLHGTRVAPFLDGVPLPAPMRLPWNGVARLDLHGEFVPAPLAGSRDAALDVTTRDGLAERVLRVEALGAPFDPTGLGEVRLTAGTPLLGDRIRVFVAASVARQDDPYPAARPITQVLPEVQTRLAASPQDVVVYRETNPADRRYLPFPEDLPAGATLDDLRARLTIPPGYALDLSGSFPFRDAPLQLTPDDFTTSRTRPGASADERRFLGRAGLALGGLDADVTYADAYDARDVFDASYALFNTRPYGRTEARQRFFQTTLGRTVGPFDVRGTVAAYRDRATTFNPAFSDGVEETFRYGSLSDPANAVAARYRRLQPDGRLVPLYADGILPSSVAGLFALPGAAGTGYAHRETDGTFLRLEGRADLRGHTVLLGVEQQQRARRAFEVADPYRIARAATSTENPASTYRDLNPYQVGSAYYGYDYLGLGRADSERFADFADGSNLDVAPLEITRVDVYGADRFRLGPLTAEVGLRYSLLSHNRRTPTDPHALAPIVRAGDLTAPPLRVDPSYAVYFSGDDVIGYRSSDGAFFDAFGAPATDAEVAGRGRVRAAPGTSPGVLDEGVFRDARTRAVLQPRVALNLAVAVDASVWLSYARTADLPDDAYLNATVAQYDAALEAAGFLPNADLAPEVATTYAVGGTIRQHALRVTATAAQRDLDDLATPMARKNVFPNNYRTFVSALQARIRSGSLLVQIDRTRGVAVEAAYTLSHATGDLFGARSAEDFFWIIRGDQFSGQDLLDETRHTITGVFDYQTGAGAGPRIGGFAPFARTRLVLTGEAHSGDTYFSLYQPTPLTAPVRLTGTRGRRTQPWSVLLHLQAMRDVPVRGRTLTLFAQVRNLLDRANVRRVYGFTGSPDDDGYLGTHDAAQLFPAGSIERFYYQARLQTPDHYGLPREIRLGLRLTL